MKRIKKALLLLLVAALFVSLCGCYGVTDAVGEVLTDAVGEALNGELGEALNDVLSEALTGPEEAIPDEIPEPEPTDIPKPEATPEPTPTPAPTPELPDENGYYTTKDDVADYLIAYRRLPPNFLTKNEARETYGWEGGGLPDDRCIGGDRFGNYEGLLPDGYSYRECDIDTMGQKTRGAKRIIFTVTEDELVIYYTDDHYESFTELYQEAK